MDRRIIAMLGILFLASEAFTAEPSEQLTQLLRSAQTSKDTPTTRAQVARGIELSLKAKDCALLKQFAELAAQKLLDSLDVLLTTPEPTKICAAGCSFSAETKAKINDQVKPWLAILNTMFDEINKSTKRVGKSLTETRALEQLLDGKLCETVAGSCAMKKSYKSDITAAIHGINGAIKDYIKEYQRMCVPGKK